MSRHTQAPWTLERFDESQILVLPTRDSTRHALIATVSVGEGRPDGEGNALVIVASPEMYTELVSAQRLLSGRAMSDRRGHAMFTTWCIEASERIAALLTKVEGKYHG